MFDIPQVISQFCLSIASKFDILLKAILIYNPCILVGCLGTCRDKLASSNQIIDTKFLHAL